jgi:hypothetical protein
VRSRLAALGHTDPNLDEALGGWAGIENLEERMVTGSIDPRCWPAPEAVGALLSDLRDCR